MRLMYVLPAEGFGGAERQGVLHIRKLADYGFDLEAVVGPGLPVQEALQRYGFGNYHHCSEFPRKTHSRMGVAGNLRYAGDYARAFFRCSDELVRIARAAGTEAIFAGRSFGWAAAARAARILHIPYLIRAGSRPTHALQGPAIRAMCAYYGQPAALLSNCAAVQDRLSEFFRCPTQLLPNGVDTDVFDASRIDGTLAVDAGLHGKIVVGIAARPAPGKGIELLMQVARACVQVRQDIVFLVAGEFGWRAHYEALVRKRGLSAHIRFLGHVDFMPTFYASCDLVVLTSPEHSIEGSPNALLEAMAMARPAVASDVGGVPEILSEGVEGFLVAPDSAELFTKRILQLAGDSVLRARLGAAGRQRILAAYSEPAAMQVLADALRRFVSSSSQERNPPDTCHERAPAAYGSQSVETPIPHRLRR